jgi:hypothetical protein
VVLLSEFDEMLEIQCSTLREEHRLRVFENRVLRGIFGPKRDENCIMRSFITCTLRQI